MPHADYMISMDYLTWFPQPLRQLLFFLFHNIENILRKMKLFSQSDQLVGLNFKSPKPDSLSWPQTLVAVWRGKDINPGKNIAHNCSSTNVSWVSMCFVKMTEPNYIVYEQSPFVLWNSSLSRNSWFIMLTFFSYSEGIFEILQNSDPTTFFAKSFRVISCENDKLLLIDKNWGVAKMF